MANSNRNNVDLDFQEQEAFYRKHIKLKVESGLPRTEYCKLHGLNYKEFGNYERKLELGNDFVPIELILDNYDLKPIVLCSVMFKNGAELKIYDRLVLPVLISSLS